MIGSPATPLVHKVRAEERVEMGGKKENVMIFFLNFYIQCEDGEQAEEKIAKDEGENLADFYNQDEVDDGLIFTNAKKKKKIVSAVFRHEDNEQNPVGFTTSRSVCGARAPSACVSSPSPRPVNTLTCIGG